MFDHILGREAFRQRLLTLVVATTGTTDLGATATGFTRAAGSFLTDGFADGMEVTGTGWPGTLGAAKIITGPVTALALPIAGGGLAVTAAAPARSLTVGLPTERRWHGTQTPQTASPATKPAIQEQWVRGAVSSIGQPPTISLLGNTGFYQITWLGLANKGLNAMSRQIDAVLELFPPGYSVMVGADMLRVEGNPAPDATGPETTENGYEMSQVRIPWRVVSANMNVVAA